jgi:hypothetical protein
MLSAEDRLIEVLNTRKDEEISERERGDLLEWLPPDSIHPDLFQYLF